jgi:uncharacterized protein YijF (DUF1287 family)
MRLFSFLIFWVLGFALPVHASPFGDALAQAAQERTQHTVHYDGRYMRLAYPGGDVPPTQGVCTDVVIRSYRALGLDLQVLVHEDMSTSFAAYPALWGLSRPDSNIDHRRVPNLQTFFTRQETKIAASDDNLIYQAGDVLSWVLPGGLTHMGIVIAPATETRPAQIVHNIGLGPQQSDLPTGWRLTGQYRYGRISGS